MLYEKYSIRNSPWGGSKKPLVAHDRQKRPAKGSDEFAHICAFSIPVEPSSFTYTKHGIKWRIRPIPGLLSPQKSYVCMFNPFIPNVFSILINSTCPFPILGLLCVIFHFCSNFKRHICKQTVEKLIRRRVLRRLIWFCIVWRCPTKRTLGIYGLMIGAITQMRHVHVFFSFSF